MKSETAGHSCSGRGQEAVRESQIPCSKKRQAPGVRLEEQDDPVEQVSDLSTGGVCQETTTSWARGSGDQLPDLHLQRKPLCQELQAEFSASSQESHKCISLHRQEQNGMIHGNCSGSFIEFCLSLMIVGLIKEHVSSQHRLARLFKYLQNVFGIPC